MSFLANSYNLVFWVTFCVAVVLSYPIYRLLLLTKSRQTIDPHAPETHQRKQGTPTMGGLMFLCALVPIALTDPYGAIEADLGNSTGIYAPLVSAMIVLYILFAVIGFVDDFLVPKLTKKRGLGWMPKLVMQIAFASIAVYIAYGTGDILKAGLAVFFILFWSNAFNFVDGLDGLSGSVLLGLAGGFIGLSSFRTDGPAVAVFCIGLVACALIFLLYNMPPAKVFMGDVGSLPIGAVLGISAFQFSTTRTVDAGMGTITEPSLLIPMLVLGFVMIAELVPVPMQVAYFKLTKGKRLFPFTPIHHAFEKKGWPESRVVWMFALVQMILSIAAVSMTLTWFSH